MRDAARWGQESLLLDDAKAGRAVLRTVVKGGGARRAVD